MSASLAAVALCNVMVPILPSFRVEDFCTAKVEHSWTTGNGANAVNHIHKMCLLTCDQFLDAAHNDRLHLSTSTLRCVKFWDIVGGDPRNDWQEISDAQVAKTIDSFMEDIDVLVGHCLSPTACQDQLECLRTGAEPFQMSCEQLGSRLHVISHLGRYLPSSTLAGVCF